jgi:hypothetical protein
MWGISAVQCFPWPPPSPAPQYHSYSGCPLAIENIGRPPVQKNAYCSAVNTKNCEVYYIGSFHPSLPLGCPLEVQRNEKVRLIYRGRPREPNHRRGGGLTWARMRFHFSLLMKELPRKRIAYVYVWETVAPRNPCITKV